MGMTSSIIVGIPDHEWKDDAVAGFGSLVMEAGAARRRLDKGVNEEAELLRYHTVCSLIEDLVWRHLSMDRHDDFAPVKDGWSIHRVKDGLPVLLGIAGLKKRGSDFELAHSAVAPEKIPDYVQELERFIHTCVEEPDQHRLDERRRVVEALEGKRCGFVELSLTRLDDSKALPLPALRNDGLTGKSSPPNEYAHTTRATSARNLESRLLERLRAAAHGTGPVQLGKMPHSVVTEALNRLTNEGGVAHSLCVLHEDGSLAPELTLQLPPAALTNIPDHTLRVSLMSMRHLALDAEVDWAWYRNIEVSRARTLAESDEFCTAHSIGLFRELASAGPCRIALYHTGFMPAILGFYRSLIRAWQEDLAIVVHPQYFCGPEKGFCPGTPWPQTEGAHHG